jgi:recombination protein RecR
MINFDKIQLLIKELFLVTDKQAQKLTLNMLKDDLDYTSLLELYELSKTTHRDNETNSFFKNEVSSDKLFIAENDTSAIKMYNNKLGMNIYNLNIDRIKDLSDFLINNEKQNKLFKLIENNDINEIIFGLNNSAENNVLIEFIKLNIENNQINFSRMATGIPIGGNLLYTDINTIKKAIENREKI